MRCHGHNGLLVVTLQLAALLLDALLAGDGRWHDSVHQAYAGAAVLAVQDHWLWTLQHSLIRLFICSLIHFFMH